MENFHSIDHPKIDEETIARRYEANIRAIEDNTDCPDLVTVVKARAENAAIADLYPDFAELIDKVLEAERAQQ